MAALEELYTRNPAKAKIFCDGEWGVDVDGLIFPNVRTAKLNVMELAKKFERRAGMDFGYQDPSCILETYRDEENKVIYVTNEFYKTGQTLEELLIAMRKMNLTKVKCWADSAEPRSIDFFVHNDCRVVPCVKGQNSVQARIAFLQNHQIIIDESCVNTINDFENFCYLKDRDGNFTDKTDHTFSHAVDALGYAYSNIYTQHKLRTLDKSILGL